MKLIIDARMVTEHLHGIARYTYELINSILKRQEMGPAALEDPQITEQVISTDHIDLYLLVNSIEETAKIFKESSKIKYLVMKSKFLSIGEQIELPIIINRFSRKDTLFHSPSFVSSPFIRLRSVMTIHDLNHIVFPQYYTKFHKYYYEYIVKTSAKRARKIFTDSNASKKEILEWMDCDDKKVLVTYCGVDSKFSVIEDIIKLKEAKEKYKLPDEFILYVGNFKPHKNVNNLIKAMTLIKNQIRLVINGKPTIELQNLIRENNLEEKIQFIGYIGDEDLPLLYNLAKIFVFPSIYEGFGLPPLEAMACGCPVITSNISSLPEVVGEAALMINSYDFNHIAKAMEELLEDNALQSELIEKGIERSKIFTWEKTTNVIINEYLKIMTV